MKKIIFLLSVSLALFQIKVYGQFSTQWISNYSSTNALNFSNEGRKTVIDANGNTFVMVDATSNVDIIGNITASTFYYVVILKYDATGNLSNEQIFEVYGHQIAGFKSSSSFGLAIDGAGYVYAGYNFVDPNSGSDIRVSKMNNNLVEEWTQKFNPTSNDYGSAMAIDASGIAYIMGRSEVVGNTTYKILKSDDFTLEISSIYSFDVNIEIPSAMILDGQKNVYVTGSKLVLGSKAIMSASCDSLGNQRWKSISNGGSTNRDDFGNNLTMGSDGYLYIIGNSDRGAISGSNFDIIVIKHFPVTGKRIWENYYSFNSYDNGLFITSFDPGFLTLGSSSLNAILVTRISEATGIMNGRYAYFPKPTSPFTTVASSTLSDFKVSSNLKVYITGTMLATDPNGFAFNAAYLTKFAFISGGRSGFSVIEEADPIGDFGSSYSAVAIELNVPTDNVIWLRDISIDYFNHSREIVDISSLQSSFSLRNDNDTEISVDQNTVNKVTVFPSIVRNEVFISNVNDIQTVEIINSLGQVVKKLNLSAHAKDLDYNLNISDLENGMYFIRVTSSQNALTNHRIVKQ